MLQAETEYEWGETEGSGARMCGRVYLLSNREQPLHGVVEHCSNVMSQCKLSRLGQAGPSPGETAANHKRQQGKVGEVGSLLGSVAAE